MHKYYVSITEADYNTTSKKFEVSIKFIGHDLEHALEKAGVPNLYLGTEKEHKKANIYLKKYIDKTFEFFVNDKKLNFTFIGKEINNDDFIYCFIESEKIEKIEKITLKNSLLTETFKSQENRVYLTINEDKKTIYFNNLNITKTINL